jgi:hypothetical protein
LAKLLLIMDQILLRSCGYGPRSLLNGYHLLVQTPGLLL